MAKSSLGRLPRFSTIGFAEKRNLSKAMRRPLSGYLGGEHIGGYWCERLSDEWSQAFRVNHAIPCNSATSGLLAACMAAGIGRGDTVWVSPYTMSASAACAKILGARIVFKDIEPVRYSINMNNFVLSDLPKAIIVTNLFGHPAYLTAMRIWCDQNKIIMIEDNAQAPFAMENNKYAGTIGHIGVYSLNTHKQIQAGEGGVAVTDNETYASGLRGAINHGELCGGNAGLNLRMTETTAAIACAQLAKAPKIIEGRRQLAHELTDMFSGIPWVLPPVEDIGCKSVFYIWAARVPQGRRNLFVSKLVLRGLPMKAGYSTPLNRIFLTDVSDWGVGSQSCPITDGLEDELMTFEVCAYDPKSSHLKKMREIIKQVAGES